MNVKRIGLLVSGVILAGVAIKYFTTDRCKESIRQFEKAADEQIAIAKENNEKLKRGILDTTWPAKQQEADAKVARLSQKMTKACK